MSKTPTPLTDAVYAAGNNQRDYTSGKAFLDMRDHARQLEQQRDAWRDVAAELAEALLVYKVDECTDANCMQKQCVALRHYAEAKSKGE